MTLDVRRRRTGGGDKAIEILDVVGRLDTPGAALLRSTVQEVLKEGLPRIAVNLADCIEIHREMMGTFHSLGRACMRAGGNLAIFGATGDVYEYVKKFSDPELVIWHLEERKAIVALGGEVEPEKEEPGEDEIPTVIALGSDKIFKALFWKLTKLGGKPVAKFDNIESCEDYIARRPVHSLLVDTSQDTYEITRFIRQVTSSPKLRHIGIFAVGPPSQLKTGRLMVQEGARQFIPYPFDGEEIMVKLDAKKFFRGLKDVYERFNAKVVD